MAVGTLPLVAVTAALAQAPHVAEWPNDESVAEWTSLDPAARLSVTRDANVTRENGGGCLEYAYTPAIGTLSGCLVPVPGGLAGGRSLHFWMKTSDYALAMVLLAETDGSR